MSTSIPAPINEAKLNEFVLKSVGELSAAMATVLAHLGDKLGLYKALAASGPITSEELAKRTGLNERYVREWLSAQAAGGVLTYDAATSRYSMPLEHGIALADENSPAFLCGAFQILIACAKDEEIIAEAFRTGKGVGWHEHNVGLFAGTERFFRPSYRGHLISEWIPSLGDIEEKLNRGGKVADVGCGLGTSTILMAQAYPKSTFIGFDYHPESIERARKAAAAAGVADRVKFEVGTAKEYPGKDYTLVTFFDCLHDMGDPVGAAKHVRETLAKDGAWMIVEPQAGDKLEDNLHPLGRLFYSASTMLCTPASKAQEVGLALGAQAGEARLSKVLKDAGFSRVRRAAETPFNMVLEARP